VALLALGILPDAGVRTAISDSLLDLPADLDLVGTFSHSQDMAYRSPPAIPDDLRTRLETARLDLLALFRTLDRMSLSAGEIPQRLLQQLFELDADYAEALWALDQPAGNLDGHVMLRDTLAALNQLPKAAIQFRKKLPPRSQPTLTQLEERIRKHLNPSEAYNMVPGRDPGNA
jgi:hypothetical protein